MYGVFIDVSVRKRAEEARELINGEMYHRIKNLFAMASALAGIAARTTTTKEAMTTDLMQRLMALAEATTSSVPTPMRRRPLEARPPAQRSAQTLPRTSLARCARDDRVPKMLVGEHSATAIALVIHDCRPIR